MTIMARTSVRPLLGVFAWSLLFAAPAFAQNAEGMFVSVPNPITSEAVARIKAQVNLRIQDSNPRRVSTVVFNFNPDGKPASTADFGSALSLQDYILKTVNNNASVATVAFVHADTTGHTVLPVLACKELVMAKGVKFGQIVGDTVGPFTENDSKKLIYQETLTARGRGDLSAIVRKMYDPDVELYSGTSTRKDDAGKKIYVDLRSEKAWVAGAVAVPGVADGQIGLYSADIARSLGLAKSANLNSRQEVAQEFGLRPTSIIDDPLQGRTPEPFKWVLKGNIDEARRDSVNRVIRDVRRRGGNALILVLECGGNELVAARKLADDLRAAQTGDDALYIVGFIPDTAPAAATVVALGCTEIVMTRGKPDANGEVKEAEIGDFSQYVAPKGTKPGAAEVEANLKSIRELAESQGYPGVLIDGMFKPELVILRVKPKGDGRQNQRRLMSLEEFEKNKGAWEEEGKVVKPAGQLLKLNATLAQELGLARTTVEDTSAKSVATALGWPEPKEPDAGWLDKFANFLTLPVVTVLLVVLGFTGLILELKVPGLTVPGIIAALCFILVFWAHSKFSGQTFVLALLLFLLGLVLVGIEIFVLPGVGACGVFGVLSMLAGLALVTMRHIPDDAAGWGDLGLKVSQYMVAMVSGVMLSFFIARFLPKLPGGNRLVLEAPVDSGPFGNSLPGAADAAELLGAIGTASTPLRPAGVVKFGDKFVDVVSDGGFVPAGTRVQVIQVEGTRIVVKEV